MPMATAVANKDESLMEHLAAAKSALATAEMHGQVLAATFPDTLLIGFLSCSLVPMMGTGRCM
jgi:hypothetical protein